MEQIIPDKLKIIFLTLLDISDVNERGIYHDLLRKFRDEGHEIYVIFPSERRKKIGTSYRIQDNINLLTVKTFNIQKTNVIEKGIGTLLLEYQYLKACKRHFSKIKFDLILYSTPPITLTKVIKHIKTTSGARAYLLLKDIFPQNAVDLGMIKKGGILHRIFSKKEAELYNVSDRIGCMSPANVDYLVKNNPQLDKNKIEVNPNSIQPLEIKHVITQKRKIRDDYNIPSEAIVCIYGGNLGKPQGIDFLIEVLNSNKERNDFFFIVAGSGTEYSKIKAWFDENIPCNSLLFESMPKNKYDELMKVADVGLIFLDRRFTIPNFPSRFLSYLENRMPVLAATDKYTDIGKVITDNNCGYWCENGDLESFNTSLNEFSKNPHLLKEMGEKGYSLLNKQYKVDVTYSKIIKSFSK